MDVKSINFHCKRLKHNSWNEKKTLWNAIESTKRLKRDAKYHFMNFISQ